MKDSRLRGNPKSVGELGLAPLKEEGAKLYFDEGGEKSRHTTFGEIKRRIRAAFFELFP